MPSASRSNNHVRIEGAESSRSAQRARTSPYEDRRVIRVPTLAPKVGAFLIQVGARTHTSLSEIPLAAWMPSFDAGDYPGVARFMLDSTHVLARAGADFAICPDNSAHLAWDHVRARDTHPVAAHRARRGRGGRARGYRRLGLLGTRFTMGGSLYRDTLAAMGIETVVPEADDFDTVDRIIFSELVDGIFTDASRQEYHRVIVRLGERGCDTVALACTEIPLLVGPAESPLPTLDSTRLLAAAALREAIA